MQAEFQCFNCGKQEDSLEETRGLPAVGCHWRFNSQRCFGNPDTLPRGQDS